MQRRGKGRGFTLIELLIVIAIVGFLATIAMYGLRQQQKKRRDVKRASNISEIQKALALYVANEGAYPDLNGCIDGKDPVSTALRAGNYISDSNFFDPLNPSDTSLCYRYNGGGATYALTFTLETDSLQGYHVGDNTIVP